MVKKKYVSNPVDQPIYIKTHIHNWLRCHDEGNIVLQWRHVVSGVDGDALDVVVLLVRVGRGNVPLARVHSPEAHVHVVQAVAVPLRNKLV